MSSTQPGLPPKAFWYTDDECTELCCFQDDPCKEHAGPGIPHGCYCDGHRYSHSNELVGGPGEFRSAGFQLGRGEHGGIVVMPYLNAYYSCGHVHQCEPMP